MKLLIHQLKQLQNLQLNQHLLNQLHHNQLLKLHLKLHQLKQLLDKALARMGRTRK